jgi:hypothetical protein
VISGHTHNYERLVVNNFPYFVDGLGGQSVISPFGTPEPGSQVRYNADFGAMLVNADNTQIQFQFITRTGTVIDTYSIPAATQSGINAQQATATAGNVANGTVQAVVSSGTSAPQHSGTITTSTTTTTTAAVGGVHTVGVAPTTAGSRSVTATNTATSSIAGTQTVNILLSKRRGIG